MVLNGSAQAVGQYSEVANDRMAARKLIVGLGNPEGRYAATRHNVGFRVVDLLGTNNGAQFKSVPKHQALMATIAAENLILAKPTTYMNLSGEAVQAILHYFDISLEDFLVVHDDVALPLGRLRLQRGGGAGGQHGVESILQHLSGDESFHRLKVGVGPDPGGRVRANYVLSSVRPEDYELYEKVLGVAAEAAMSWLKSGIQEAMNVFNGMTVGVPFELKELVEKQEREKKEREEQRRKRTEEKKQRDEEERKRAEEKKEPEAEVPDEKKSSDDKAAE